MHDVMVPEYETRDDVYVTRLARFLGIALHAFYRISTTGIEHLEQIRHGPGIVLPKHQSNMDITLEGVLLHEHVQRHPYYLMKKSLSGRKFPFDFERAGGISITRAKDVRRAQDRRMMMRKAQSEHLFERLAYHLSQDEIIVVHPEGQRCLGALGKISRGTIANLVALQSELQKPIPYIPIRIEYSHSWLLGYAQRFLPGTHIRISVQPPLIKEDLTIDELAQHLAQTLWAV